MRLGLCRLRQPQLRLPISLQLRCKQPHLLVGTKTPPRFHVRGIGAAPLRNRKAISYNVVNELLSTGIKPFVTLFHWDPRNHWKINMDDFVGYVDVCFMEFGDRVKHWITFNEPLSYCSAGYATGIGAPGRCSSSCPAGNSGTEPYSACHHLLLAHIYG